MDSLPFEIPKSLVTYTDHFENDPQKAIDKLKNRIQRLGSDAVAHFLLAWFYYKIDNIEEAIDNALKAKTFAPGSPFLEYLHYLLIHPEAFEAWVPENYFRDRNFKSSISLNSNLIQDLETLIQRLTEAESKKITLDNDSTDSTDLSLESQTIDDIASETLAKIYEEQGKFDEAITMYERLSDINKDKRDDYHKQIDRLKENT
jgi:tetratricopeptide (TPR) repeat protein